MSQPRTVSLGDKGYRILPFGALKGTIAMEIITGVSEQAQKVWEDVAEFEENYRKEHHLRVDEQLCVERLANLDETKEKGEQYLEEELPGEDISDEEKAQRRVQVERGLREAETTRGLWEQRQQEVKASPEGFIDRPQGPAPFQIAMYGVPKAFTLARKEAFQLLALCLIPVDRLKPAYKEGTADDLLDEIVFDELLDADIEEFVDLCVAVGETLEEQLATRLEAWGKLQALGQRALRRFQGKSPVVSGNESTSELPTSSISSPTPTDGSPTESSQSDSASSVLSPSA